MSVIRTMTFLAATAVLIFTLPVQADDWLIDADEDTRAERLSSYLGGFSAAMWEVGNRWERMAWAIQDDNFELAHYHWDKVGDAIRGGYMKRPARQANADAMFLDGIWKKYLETLESGDSEAIRKQFDQARDACMACHVAEDVAFMNRQPMFTELGVE